MRDLNINLMELYKKTDKFLSDAYSSKEGVNKYIETMEKKQQKGMLYVSKWESDYKMLKHVRWIRNQLAHEVSIDNDVCEQEDYDWLERFYNSLYTANDPISRLRKRTEELGTMSKKNKQKTHQTNNDYVSDYNTGVFVSENQPQKTQSFFKRILAYLRRK